LNILVIGGAGYIGSHMTLQLEQSGHQVVVLDNLCSGKAAAVGCFPFYEADMADVAVLDVIFRSHAIDVVMHFAGHIEVAESVSDPAKYYKNNVVKTQLVLDVMRRHKVKQFIFIADASLAKEILAWQPERAALEDIIADAWVWEQKLCADLAG